MIEQLLEKAGGFAFYVNDVFCRQAIGCTVGSGVDVSELRPHSIVCKVIYKLPDGEEIVLDLSDKFLGRHENPSS